MKTFIARFYLVTVLAVVLVMELFWALFVSVGSPDDKRSLVMQLLFPVLFLVGNLHHFFSGKLLK